MSNDKIKKVNPPPPSDNLITCACNENMRRALQVVFENPATVLNVNLNISNVGNVNNVSISRLPGNYDGSYLIVNPPIMGQTNILTTSINSFTITNRPGFQTPTFTVDEMTMIFPRTLIPFNENQQFSCSTVQQNRINESRQVVGNIPLGPTNYLFNFIIPPGSNVGGNVGFVVALGTTRDISYEGIIFVASSPNMNYELPNTIINSCSYLSVTQA